MNDSFIWKTDRPWPNQRLNTGAIIGHTTDTSTRIWLRTGRTGGFILLLYPLEMESCDSFHASLKAVPFTRIGDLPNEVTVYEFKVEDHGRDTTHVENITGLEPLTEYGYALFGMNASLPRILLGHDRKMTFRTMPDTTAPMSFGFYSCHMPYRKTLFGNTELVNIEMWDCFNEVLDRHYKEDLRFIIGGGDQVYTDGVATLDIWSFLNKVMRKEDGKVLPGKDDMVSWYRDIYRGYWGFASLRKAFSSYPTYMIWDDHELGDGWGSHFLKQGKNDELHEILPDWKDSGLTRTEVLSLVNDMKDAGCQVYDEYQHSHNPDAAEKGQYDYSTRFDCHAFYFLDGRGHRDVNKASDRILGADQMARFEQWLSELDTEITRYVFIVSAVPLVHLCSLVANADDNMLADLAGIQDDLRDAWEHELHDDERRRLLRLLFDAADRGVKISILSGDVHTSAAFRLKDDETGSIIYQLTSSAITYNKPRLLGWLLGKTVAEEGHSEDGYTFERLALYTDSNFSLVKVDPERDRVMFQLYGQQIVSDPFEEEEDVAMTHAIARLELNFNA